MQYPWPSPSNSSVPFLTLKTLTLVVQFSNTQAPPCRIGLMTGAGPPGEAGGMLRIGVAVRKVGAAGIHGKLAEIHGELGTLPWFHAGLKLQRPTPRRPRPKLHHPSHRGRMMAVPSLNRLRPSKMKAPRLRAPLRWLWLFARRHLLIRELVCCADQRHRAACIRRASWCGRCCCDGLMQWVGNTHRHSIVRFRTHRMHLGMIICWLYHLLPKRSSSPPAGWPSLACARFLKSRTQTRGNHVWILLQFSWDRFRLWCVCIPENQPKETQNQFQALGARPCNAAWTMRAIRRARKGPRGRSGLAFDGRVNSRCCFLLQRPRRSRHAVSLSCVPLSTLPTFDLLRRKKKFNCLRDSEVLRGEC